MRNDEQGRRAHRRLAVGRFTKASAFGFASAAGQAEDTEREWGRKAEREKC